MIRYEGFFKLKLSVVVGTFRSDVKMIGDGSERPDPNPRPTADLRVAATDTLVVFFSSF